MRIVEVTTNTDIQAFYQLTADIYADDVNWTEPLQDDIEAVFNPQTNSLFSNGEAKRWLCIDDDGKVVGRIAAFYNSAHNAAGGIGFFECIADIAVSKLLFDTAVQWLTTMGCQQVEGPINFGEKDRYCGVLVKGFDRPALYLDNYNPLYYSALFSDYGFTVKEEVLTLKIALASVPTDKIQRLSQVMIKAQGLHFKALDYANLASQAKDIHSIYCQAFSEDNRMKHLSADDIVDLLQRSAPVLESGLVWLAYKGETAIGWVACMNDLHQMLRAEQALPTGGSHNLKGMAMAVLPQYQNTGVSVALVGQLANYLLEKQQPYDIYFSGINAKTRRMVDFAKTLNGIVDKKHHIYIYNI